MSSSSSSEARLVAGSSILVIGADGQIGSAVAGELVTFGADVTRTTRRPGGSGVQWDLERTGIPFELAGRHFDAVVLAAATATLDDCERDPESSRRVNVDRPVEIAAHWGQRGSRVIALSTSLVFDGEAPFPEPTDDKSPTCEYARQKDVMERELLERCDNVGVLRMTKVVSAEWTRLVDWHDRFSRGEEVPAFADTGFSPVTLPTAVSAVLRLVARSGSEIVHLSARDEMSYVEFAELVFARAGGQGRVVPQRARGTIAYRRHATLGTSTQELMLDGNDRSATDVVRELLQ